LTDQGFELEYVIYYNNGGGFLFNTNSSITLAAGDISNSIEIQEPLITGDACGSLFAVGFSVYLSSSITYH
jgi:hypothetical protein